MAKNKQTRKFRIATLLLSVIMLIAASSFFLAACSKDDTTDDDSSTTTRTDTQTFANADFEYFNDSDGSYRIASPENWTSATGSNSSGVSASSSVAKSGIVDTSFDWSEFVTAYNDYNTYKDKDEDERPDPYYTDIDNLYDIPGWDVAKSAAEDDKDPEDDAIKAAAKALNPGTPFSAKETEDETNGSHVLMLHNYRSNNYGTAARYTSSSITLAAGTAAKISVWVKTSNMTYNDGVSVSGNRGAYIQINNTVGGVSQDALVVRNIDTKDITENNGWEQYTFYINASPYSATTFTVELGLGVQTEGKNTNYLEYVQGYAFFDDLEYTLMQSSDFAQAIADIPAEQALDLSLGFGTDLAKIDAAQVSDNRFSLNLDITQLNAISLGSITVDDTRDDRGPNGGNTVATYFPNGNKLTANRTDDLNKSGIKTVSDFTEAAGYTKAFLKDFEKFNDLPFGGAAQNVVVLYSSLGAPYTATLSNDNINGNLFTLDEDEYLLISFWVKTSDLQGGTGLTATVINGETETSIGAVDTTTLTTVDLVDDQKKEDKTLEQYEDIFDGWQQCFFFVSNTTDKDGLEFSLEFSYGPTTISGSALSSYQAGYAAIAGLSAQTLSADEFALKSTGTYAVEVSLTDNTVTSNSSFDSVAYTDSSKIETDVANLRSYTGVFGNSVYVGGEMLENDAQNTINANPTAGLISKEYTKDNRKEGSGYSDELAWMQVLKTHFPTITDVLTNDLWNEIFGNDCDQPLLIANTVAQSYGFIANATSSISSSSYAQVTLRVKLSPGAVANIYLIESSDKDFGEKKFTDALSFASGISYRYDKDGNVVDEDSNILLYFQSNGLWSATKNHSGNIWYANLANYAKDEDGNLIDSDKAIVYYASENEQEQADGIYYRYKNNDGDLEVKVQDFSKSGVDLTKAVVQQATNKTLQTTVTNETATVSDWMYVRFFIATGDESKNYRLEVWSGSRDGKQTNAANSFVVYDVVNYTSLDQTTFDELVNENLDNFAQELSMQDADELLEAYEKNPAEFIDRTDSQSLVYYNFSLYDDDDYKPFDTNYSDSSNPYADYDASTYSNTVAYFNYNYSFADTKYYDTYVNYAAYEITVATATDDSTTDDEDTTHTHEHDQNVWLLVASIVLAAALVFTLVALLIRKLLANIRKKNVKNKPMYDNKRKRYIRKLKLEEAEREVNENDVLPDEDEISDEDIYKIDEEESAQPDENVTELPQNDDDDSDKGNA